MEFTEKLIRFTGLLLVLALTACGGAADISLPSSLRIGTNGDARAIAQDGNGVTYIGGEFTRVHYEIGNGVPLDVRSGAPT